MPVGNCQLCGQRSDLVESHIWSRFAYKRYAADRAKGGQFLDLMERRLRNGQYKRFWFCLPCDRDRLGVSERYVSELCDRLEKQQADAFGYDDRLLRFATSISFRSALHSLERDQPRRAVEDVRAACRVWRSYLLGGRTHVRPYTQHLFVVFDREWGSHQGLGGQVFPVRRIVHSQIGPLFLIGLLSRAGISRRDLAVWDYSEIVPGGGTVKPVSEWVVGRTITPDLVRHFDGHIRSLVRQVVKTGEAAGLTVKRR